MSKAKEINDEIVSRCMERGMVIAPPTKLFLLSVVEVFVEEIEKLEKKIDKKADYKFKKR